MNWKKDGYEYVILFALTVLIFFLGLGNRDLWTPDEPRVAEIGREMALEGNYVVPMLNRKPFLEQPPLFYLSLAFAYRITGRVEDWVARIPSAFYSFLGTFAVFLIGRNLFGTKVGILGAFILATCLEYFRVSRWVIVDSALSCFIFFALWAFLKAYFGHEGSKALYYFLMCIFSTLAFFVKGFIGVAIPALTVISFLIFERNVGEIRRMKLQYGITVFLVSLGIWTWLLYKEGNVEYLKIFFVDNNLLRFFPGGTSGHQNPFYYYFLEFPSAFFPWIILFFPALVYVFSKSPQHEKKALLFLKCYFISGFVLLSLASTKRILYMVPIFPSAALMVALYLDHFFRSENRTLMETSFTYIHSGIIFALGIGLLPLVIFFSNKYGTDLKGEDILRISIFSFAIASLSAISIFDLRRLRFKKSIFFSGMAHFSFLLFLLFWVSPYINPYKSFKPFMEKVLKEIPKGEPVYAYKPDETLRGFFPFYSGIYPIEVKEENEIRSSLRNNPMYVVIRDKNDVLRKELLNLGLKEVFYVQRADRRSLALFKSYDR